MQAPLRWHPWSKATFELAARTGKPIYVNVAAGWCHWCHVMDERTFGDAGVRHLLEDRFVAIRVDADARPDLAERYQDFGWPANAFLTPQAEPLLELRGFQEPADFRALLARLADEAAAGTLQGRREPMPSPPASGPLDALRDEVQARLDGFYDPAQGGWGRTQKYPFPAPVEQAFWRARLRGDPASFRRALQTLRGTLRLIDPAWGGVSQYSMRGTWTAPHFERIAAVQAGCIESFTQAWQWTDDPAWARAATQVRDYVLAFLLRPDGAFATSQDADTRTAAGEPVPGERYYRLDDAARRQIGLPRTDTAAYADWNGVLVHAFARHAQATGDAVSLNAAVRAAATILGTHGQEAGGLRHGQDADRVLHLRDNAAMGRACLALHQATGDASWLPHAESLATCLLDGLASLDGGFFAHTPDPEAAGAFTVRRRPVEDNGLAIRFLADLAHLTADGDLALRARTAAEDAARALATPQALEPEAQIIGQFLVGLEALAHDPLVFAVAGPSGPARAELHRAALACPVPGRLVRLARPTDGYPAGEAAIFICRGTACSAPVRAPDALPAAVARMLG